MNSLVYQKSNSLIIKQLTYITFSRTYRGYYRCTHRGCNVKKQIQRLFEDGDIVVTTYEGMHSHPIEHSNDNFENILSQMKIYSGFWVLIRHEKICYLTNCIVFVPLQSSIFLIPPWLLKISNRPELEMQKLMW